jgi:hypothetical protein
VRRDERLFQRHVRSERVRADREAGGLELLDLGVRRRYLRRRRPLQRRADRPPAADAVSRHDV